jgi:hypothetical protein
MVPLKLVQHFGTMYRDKKIKEGSVRIRIHESGIPQIV